MNYKYNGKKPYIKKNVDKLEMLLIKIFKFISEHQRQNIKYIITNKNRITNKLSVISHIISNIIINKQLIPDDHRQDYIIDKIYLYITKNNLYNEIISNIVDIGGGNGNVLNGLRLKIEKNIYNNMHNNNIHNNNIHNNNIHNNNIHNNNMHKNKKSYICVETLTDWIEQYNFTNQYIEYIFWDNKEELNIENNSVKFIFCMVSLHHMNDNTIYNLIQQMYRILSPGGYIFIKEHDTTIDNRKYIEWEHHLYHILDCGYEHKQINLEKYAKLVGSYNFKSKENWQQIFETQGFILKDRLNRFLDKPFNYIDLNPSSLYWDVYIKPIIL